MWKTAFTWAIVGLLTAGAIHALAGPIPYMNAGQMQLPATAGDMNALINQVNANVMLAGPGGSVYGVGQPSGVFNINQSNLTSMLYPALSSAIVPPSVPPGLPTLNAAGNNGAQANGVVATGGTAGVAPVIQAVGSDQNVNLGLATQGTGLVQFASETSWESTPTLAICPGYTGRPFDTNPVAGLAMTPNPTVTGYLYILDYLGKPHAIPVC